MIAETDVGRRRERSWLPRRHRRTPRRDVFHELAALGAGAHFAFELAGGSGLVLQRRLGLPAAAAFWTGLLGAWAQLGRRGRAPRLLAAAAGSSVTGAALHFYMWPSSRHGVPLLTQAEGFRRSWMPAYNAVLYGWAAAGAGAVVATPPRARPWAAAGALATVAATPAVLRHYAWLQDQASARPAWWNRSGRRRPGLDIKPSLLPPRLEQARTEPQPDDGGHLRR